jgi:putative ABC transport system substrate-binding protein
MLLALSVILVLLIPSFGFIAETAKPISIGAILGVQHPAFDAVYNGFLDSLTDHGYVEGTDYTLDYQNANNDQSIMSTIGDRFVSNNVDFILSVGTQATVMLAGKTEDIPIMGSAITDYVSARLADANEKPGHNVSGTSDMQDIAAQIALILRLAPEVKTVGVLYNSGETNSVVQAGIAKAAIEALGLTYAEVTITNSSEVQQGMERIAAISDAIYLPTDNTVAVAMPIVYGVSVDAKIPVVCGEEGMTKVGGLATIGVNYYDIGYQTGDMAVRFWEEGLVIGDMPIELQSKAAYAINGTIAEEIGIEIPEDLLEYVFYMDEAAE